MEILSPTIQLLQKNLQENRDSALSKFWAEIKTRGTPIIEPDKEDSLFVTFLWQHDDSARNVAVIQDWGADGIREHHMSRLPDSDVWYLTRRMHSDTRTTYQLSPSSSIDPTASSPYQLDPLNPNIFTAYPSETGHDIQFSLLELPDAPALPWRQSNTLTHGTVELHTPLADQRRLWVYRPPGQETQPLPVLVVFDGRLYKDSLRVPEMLDFLIGHGRIPPVAALLVDNPDRNELLCKNEFADYMVNQVMPWLRAQLPVSNEPHKNVLVGSSLGGLFAAFVSHKYPEVWGTVLSQTGWFRWHPEDDSGYHWLARPFLEDPKRPLRFWLQVGNLEVARMLDGGPTQLDANRHFRDVLQGKGYELSYYEYSGGHDASSLEFPLAKAILEIFK